jgi:hypothetical protein
MIVNARRRELLEERAQSLATCHPSFPALASGEKALFQLVIDLPILHSEFFGDRSDALE